MTLGDMRQSIAAYLNKDLATFQVNGVDLITQALDRASIAAQRRHDFEVLRARITTSMVLGTTYTMQADWKKVLYVWLAGNQVRGPVRIVRESEIHRRSMYTTSALVFDAVYFQGYYSDMCFALRGREYYLFPTTSLLPNASVTEFPVNMDIVTFFPVYGLQTQDYEDHLLQYGSDYLLYFAVRELSFRTRSSAPADQLPISAKMVEEAFQGLVMHDTNVSDGSFDTSLA